MRPNDAMGLLVAVFMDWGGALANPRFVRVDRLVAWDRYGPRVLDYPVTMRDVAELAAQGQYTFQVTEDGSLIQLVYEFEHNEEHLRRATLAYYGAEFPDAGVIEAPQGVELEDREGFPYAQVPWLRIDYDPRAARGVVHGDCHLHISGLPNSRFLVHGVPTPKQFVELIMLLFYPDAYEAHRLKENGSYIDREHVRRINDPAIECAHSEIFELMTHVYVPRRSGINRR